jgi:hypothetical protein
MPAVQYITYTPPHEKPKTAYEKAKEKALERIRLANPRLAVDLLVQVLFRTDAQRWSERKKQMLLRSVWNEIDCYYREFLFDTAADMLYETLDSKDQEYRIRARNRSKYHGRVRSIGRLPGELVGSSITELDEEFEFGIDFGKCCALVELMCSGELEITETKLVAIAEHLR